MIHLIPNLQIPLNVYVAFSGGVDSLAVAHFLKRGGRGVTLLHFNHGCEYSREIQEGVEKAARALDLMLHTDVYFGKVPKGESLEDFWRKRRYAFLNYYKEKVITCHHLNDAVETWLFTSFHGEGKIIPVRNKNIIRPFLLNPKQVFIDYCNTNRLNDLIVKDPYNFDQSLTRNFIRSNIVPLVEKINPGLEKVIRKKYLKGAK